MDMTEDGLAVVYILGVILNNVTSFNCDNETIQVSVNSLIYTTLFFYLNTRV